MRSQPSVFVNCDICDRDNEILLGPQFSWRDHDEYVDAELKDLGWLVDNELGRELCPKCKEKQNEPTTTTTPT